MEVRIEPYNAHHLDAVIRLSLRAWTPVFESIQNAMDADVYRAFYPDHWRVSQVQAVEEVYAAEEANVWVVIDIGSTVGFVAVKLHSEDNMGSTSNSPRFVPTLCGRYFRMFLSQ